MRPSSSPEPKIRRKSTEQAALVFISLLIVGSLASNRVPVVRPVGCVPSEARAEKGHSVSIECASKGGGLPLRGPARRVFAFPLDPNQADATTLETLPGVGPRRARAWIETRRQEPFRRPADLERIPGIGPKRSAALAPLLRFPDAPRSAAPTRIRPGE